MSLLEDNKRHQEEDRDEIENVIPPPDIIAFNESRSCADLYRMHEQGQLITKSDFQRQIVWNDKEQALFVDSLIKQLPIPSLCISLDVSSQKRFVIDGLQRISTIIRFLDYQKNDWKFPKAPDIDKRLSQKLVSSIAKNDRDIISRVENLSIPITVLRCNFEDHDHMAYLFQIFKRLNSGGRKLYNQEIRNCVYSGTFNNFLKTFVKQELWLKAAQTTQKKVEEARFSNEERVLRFLAFHYNRNNYSGNLARFLNSFMELNKKADEQKISEFQSIITSTLLIMNKLTMPEKIVKNKNLFEGIMIGISENLENLKKEKKTTIQSRLDSLLSKDSYKKAPEGMSHTSNVLTRMDDAISAFGA